MLSPIQMYKATCVDPICSCTSRRLFQNHSLAGSDHIFKKAPHIQQLALRISMYDSTAITNAIPLFNCTFVSLKACWQFELSTNPAPHHHQYTLEIICKHQILNISSDKSALERNSDQPSRPSCFYIRFRCHVPLNQFIHKGTDLVPTLEIKKLRNSHGFLCICS